MSKETTTEIDEAVLLALTVLDKEQKATDQPVYAAAIESAKEILYDVLTPFGAQVRLSHVVIGEILEEERAAKKNG